MSFTSPAAQLWSEDGDSLPGNAELDAALAALADGGAAGAELRQVGASRTGRPIMMLSLGEGDRSALVVGAPHPNEPVGGATVIRLARRLAEDEALRRRLGLRWHFIGAIDPDGLALNDGWLRGPRTLQRYYRGFFRPALDQQPEYTFPLEAGGHRFDRPTPENLAWREALELTRPAYQVSLHSADQGGVFYVVSRDIPGLAAALASEPERAGVTLNPFGEPFSEMAPYAPGVFGFPDFAGMIAAAGARAAEVWPAGESSAGYSAARYGTFNLVCEVPLWDDPRLGDTRPSPFSMADVLARQQRRLAAALDSIAPTLDALPAGDGDQAQLSAAVDEFVAMAPRQAAQLEALQSARDWSTPIPVQKFAVLDTILALATIRPQAMLARLATMAGAAGTATEAEARVADAVRLIEAEATLTPLSVRRMSDIQMHAILTGAEALRSET